MTDASQRGEVVVVPREPTEGTLVNMAIRSDHGLGCPGYYDQPIFGGEGVGHEARLRAAKTTMRQLYEEVVLSAAPPAPSGDSGAWEALDGMLRAFCDPMTRRALGGHNDRQMEAVLTARQALALRDAGGGSLPPAAPSSVPGDTTADGAGQLVTVPREQLETLCRSLELGNLLPGEGETLINCWIMASGAEARA